MAKRYPEDKAGSAYCDNAQAGDYAYYEHFDDEEMDVFMAALAYLLIRHTDMDREDVYSLLFQNGGGITWH